ncbi:MAG: hypothetical protein VKK59_07845 [Vampirovibrionales bacterium]|jgi:hypothetical protein|nr:hypothetical protein [Vampirovibrionales bacterium]
MYVEDGVVRIEPDDQCATCQYFLKGVSCPLIEALGVGIVSLEIEVSVTNCGFYKEFKRHLQVIKTEAPEPETPSDGGQKSAGKKTVKRAKKL